MVKRGKIFIRLIGFSQIISIVISLFSFAFLISESSIVSGQGAGAIPQVGLIPGSNAVGGTGIISQSITVGGQTLNAGRFAYSVKGGGMTLTQGTNVIHTTSAELQGALGRVEYVDPSKINIPGNPGAGEDIGYLDRALGDDPLGGWEYWKGGIASHLVSGLIWGGIAYGVVTMLGVLFGLDDNQQEALSTAASAG